MLILFYNRYILNLSVATDNVGVLSFHIFICFLQLCGGHLIKHCLLTCLFLLIYFLLPIFHFFHRSSDKTNSPENIDNVVL